MVFLFLIPQKKLKITSEKIKEAGELVDIHTETLENKKRYFDIVVLLEELYPFRMDDLIDNMILKFVSEGYDTLFSGSKEKCLFYLAPKIEL